MKEKILFAFLIFFVACGPNPSSNTSKEFLTQVYTGIDNTNIYEYTIDSCIYIGFIGGRSSFLSHKGNCPNKIHFYNLTSNNK